MSAIAAISAISAISAIAAIAAISKRAYILEIFFKLVNTQIYFTFYFIIINSVGRISSIASFFFFIPPTLIYETHG